MDSQFQRSNSRSNTNRSSYAKSRKLNTCIEQMSSSDFSGSFESSMSNANQNGVGSSMGNRSRSRSQYSYSGNASDRSDVISKINGSSQSLSRNSSFIHFPKMYNSVSGSSFDNMSPQSSLLLVRTNKEQICGSNYDSENTTSVSEGFVQNNKLFPTTENNPRNYLPALPVSSNNYNGNQTGPKNNSNSISDNLSPLSGNLTIQQQAYLHKFIQQQQIAGHQQIQQIIQNQIQTQNITPQQQYVLQQQLTQQLNQQLQQQIQQVTRNYQLQNQTQQKQIVLNSQKQQKNGQNVVYPFLEGSSSLQNEPVPISCIQRFRPGPEYLVSSVPGQLNNKNGRQKFQKPTMNSQTSSIINPKNLSDVNLFGRSFMPFLNVPFSVHDTSVLCEKYINEVIMNQNISLTLEEAWLDTKPEFLKYGNNDFERMFTHQLDSGKKPDKQKYFCYLEKAHHSSQPLRNIITHPIYTHRSKLSTWMAHVANKGKLGSNELIYVTLFLRRLRFKYNVLITPENVHALALSCLSLGLKTHSDVWFCLGSFEYLGESKHPKNELFNTEMAIILACNFDFFVSYFEIFGFLKTLLDLWLIQSD